LFRAFKIGVAKLLDELEPKGEMVPPRIHEYADGVVKRLAGTPAEKRSAKIAEDMIRTWKSPSSVASEAVRKTLSDLYDPIPPPEVEYRGELSRSMFKPFHDQRERTWYGMSDVRRDLQLTKPEKANAKPKRISKSKP